MVGEFSPEFSFEFGVTQPTLSAEKHAIWYGTITDNSGSISSGGASQLAVAANPSRKYLYVQNPNSASESLFLNFTNQASSSLRNSFELFPGQAVIFDTPAYMTREALNVTAATAGHKFICKEA